MLNLPQQAEDDQAPAQDDTAPAQGFQPQTVSQGALAHGNSFSPDEIPPASPPPEHGEWDTFVSKLKLASLDSGVGFIPGYEGPLIRSAVEHSMESDLAAQNQPKLTPEQANKMYPGLPVPFNEPVYPQTADLIASTQKRRDDLQAWIAQGPGLGAPLEALTGAAAGGLAGLSTGNPYGVAAGAVMGGAFGAYAGGASVVAGFANPVTLALMAATGGLGRMLAPAAEIGAGGIAAVDGVVVKGAPSLGNAAAQALAVNAGTAAADYPQLIKERQNISMKDEAITVLGGTLGGMALHVATGALLGQISDSLNKARFFTKPMDEATQARNLRAAISQHETGSDIDMSPAVQEMQSRAAGEVQPGSQSFYEFKPVDHPSQRPQFLGRTAEHNSPLELDDMGPGTYLSDNGQAINNLVSAPDSPHTGTVHEAEVNSDAKFLDLDAPLPKELADQAIAEIRKQGVGQEVVPDSQIRGANASDIMALFRGLEAAPGEPSATEVMRTRMQGEGFDGYKWVHTDQDLSQNRTLVFDPKHVAVGEEYKANKQSTPRMSDGEAEDASQLAQSREASRNADPERDQRIAELQAEKPAGTDPDRDMEYVKEQKQNAMAALKKMAVDDPSLLEDPEYKALLHEETQNKQEEQTMKDMLDCMVGEST